MTDLNDANVTTYILAGDDYNSVYHALLRNMEHRDHVKILRATDYPNLADAVRQIKTPANIILAVHGASDGTFGWQRSGFVRANEESSYRNLFAMLPRQGIGFISVSSCFGGTALDQTATLPTGTVLQSSVGAKAENVSNSAFIHLPVLKPTDMILRALGTVEPYHVSQENALPDLLGKENPISPNDVLPHMIAIGGHPPQSINLDQVSNAMADAAKAGKLNLPVLNDARNYIKQFFTPDYYNPADISARIDAVTQKIAHGEHLTNLSDQRIGYALAVSYLNKTGELQHCINEVIAHDHVQPPPPQTKPPELTAPPVTHPTLPPEQQLHPVTPPPVIPNPIIPKPQPQPRVTPPNVPPPQETAPPEHHEHHTQPGDHEGPPHRREHHGHHEHHAHHHHHAHAYYGGYGLTHEQALHAQTLFSRAGYGHLLGHYGPHHDGRDGMWGRHTQHAFEVACREAGVDPHHVHFGHHNATTTEFILALTAKAHTHTMAHFSRHVGHHHPVTGSEPVQPPPLPHPPTRRTDEQAP